MGFGRLILTSKIIQKKKEKRKVLFFKLHATQNEQNNLFIQRCKERGWISAAGMSSLAGKQIIN